jgi:CRP/FNR family cyclic AMP-dependent transcriptional regulator
MAAMRHDPPEQLRPDLPAGASPSLRRLAARGPWRQYRKGTLLIQEGDVGDTLYIIVRGRLRVFAGGDNGREITYGIYGPGEYLGEMSLDGGPRSANVVTLEPCTCAVIGRATLLQHIADEPEFAIELIGKLIRRARAATLSARQLALNDVYGRLRGLLEASAEPQADGTARVRARPTHLDVAKQLGCSREMVSRLLKDLERGGFLAAEADDWIVRGPLPMRW